MRRFRFRANTNPMTCHEAATVLQSYLDGELDDLRSRRVGAHLAVCRRCGLDLDAYAQIKGSLARGSKHRHHDEAAAARLRSFAEQLAAGNIDAANPPPPRRSQEDE